MISLVKNSIAALSLAIPTVSLATVDAFIAYNIPYEHLQVDDICFAKVPMWAELGIPSASAAVASFHPKLIVRQSSGLGTEQVNINLLAEDVKASADYIHDEWDEEAGIITTHFSIDLAPLNAAYGTEQEGRAKTIRWAKLALLTLAENQKDMLFGEYKNYRLKVDFKNLPSQTGLTGKTLYPETRYPYTEGSPLLKSYRAELINRDGNCPDNII